MTTLQSHTGTGTLRSVLNAFTAGALTVGGISRATGLDGDLVRVALDQLVSLGMISRDEASSGCPPKGCGGCSAPTGNGCATGSAASRGGLVTLTLSRPPAR